MSPIYYRNDRNDRATVTQDESGAYVVAIDDVPHGYYQYLNEAMVYMYRTGWRCCHKGA